MILAIIAAIAAAASAAAAGYAAYAAADAAATNERRVEAETAYKVRQEENEAIRIRNEGLEQEARVRRENAQTLSRQRARLGASGVDIEAGSALDLQEDTVTLGKEDELNVREHFQDQAKAMDMRAILTQAHGDDVADFYGDQRTDALVGGAFAIGTALVGGIGSVAGASTSSTIGAGQTASSSNTSNYDSVKSQYFNSDSTINSNIWDTSGSRVSSKWYT